MALKTVLRGHLGRFLKLGGRQYSRGDVIDTADHPDINGEKWDQLQGLRLVEDVERAGGPSRTAARVAEIVADETHACDECAFTSVSAQGLKTHITRKHKKG